MKVAVASGKGGAGKTTLSVNLASFLAERYSVALADLDVEEPNCALFLNEQAEEITEAYRDVPAWKQENCSLCGKCQEVCQFNAILRLGEKILVFPELCHSCHACTELCPDGALEMAQRMIGKLSITRSTNPQFVEGRLNIGEEQAVPMIRQTLNRVKYDIKGIDWLILDSPPGTACPMAEAVSEADLVILVAEPTPFGLHDFKLISRSLDLLGKPYALVVNKQFNDTDPERSEGTEQEQEQEKKSPSLKGDLGGCQEKEKVYPPELNKVNRRREKALSAEVQRRREKEDRDGILQYCSEHNIPIAGKIYEDPELARRSSGGHIAWQKIPHLEHSLDDIAQYLLVKKLEMQ